MYEQDLAVTHKGWYVIVAELISMSTPQMIYKVKRVSNESQKTMKETKANNNITKMTICHIYKGVCKVCDSCIMSSARWLVSVVGMVEVVDRCS